MNNFIIYAADGFTQDKDGVDIDNCQILGWASGRDQQEALMNFWNENGYLKGRFDNVMCQRVGE